TVPPWHSILPKKVTFLFCVDRYKKHLATELLIIINLPLSWEVNMAKEITRSQYYYNYNREWHKIEPIGFKQIAERVDHLKEVPHILLRDGINVIVGVVSTIAAAVMEVATVVMGGTHFASMNYAMQNLNDSRICLADSYLH